MKTLSHLWQLRFFFVHLNYVPPSSRAFEMIAFQWFSRFPSIFNRLFFLSFFFFLLLLSDICAVRFRELRSRAPRCEELRQQNMGWDKVGKIYRKTKKKKTKKNLKRKTKDWNVVAFGTQWKSISAWDTREVYNIIFIASFLISRLSYLYFFRHVASSFDPRFSSF